MIGGFLKRLNEPFPSRDDDLHELRQLTGVGVFVALFLFVIKPFGLHNEQQNLLLVCLGFGLVTIVCGWSFHLFCRYVLRIRTDVPSWTLAKWIVQLFFMLAWIAVGNLILQRILYAHQPLNLSGLWMALQRTMLVGVFPIIFSGLMIQMRADRANRQQAESMQPNRRMQTGQTAQPQVELAISPSESFLVAPSNILYLEAMQNYVSVHYLEREALEGQDSVPTEVQSQILRNTIANLAEQLAEYSIIRCHRSYLVNIESIEQVSGNAQGLKLQLRGLKEKQIPVSRTYIPKLKERLD